jgi:4-hydroxy-4-methyl-2-oxoglutarate aldolase
VNPSFESLVEAGTSVIADVFDSLGWLPPVLDTSLLPIKEGAARKFIGPAYTVSGESHLWSGSGDRAKLAAIDAMTPGVVPVWAGNDIKGVCCFGDLLGSAMLARGCAGVVVDGGVRDVAFLRSIEMPIVARYKTPAQAIGRWRVTAWQTPVRVRGALEERVTVNPGDIVVADDDGVIVLPADSLDAIVTRVIEWSKSESGARVEIRNGLPLLRALEKYGHL